MLDKARQVLWEEFKSRPRIGVLILMVLLFLAVLFFEDRVTRLMNWTLGLFPGWNTSLGLVGALAVIWILVLVTDAYFNMRRREAGDIERAALALVRPLLYAFVAVVALGLMTFERYTDLAHVERSGCAERGFAAVERGFDTFADYGTPDFRPIIVDVDTGTPTSGGPDDATLLANRSYVVMDVAVDNLGAPAFLGSWRIEVILSPGDIRRRLLCPPLPEEYRLTLNFGPEPVVAGADLLNNRLRRIERNDRLRGKLVCQGNDIPEGLLVQEDVTICFVVADLRPEEWEQCQPLIEPEA